MPLITPLALFLCTQNIMDLYSHQPYWLMKDGIVGTYTSLDKSFTTDIAIIGAGISGALAAYYLRNTGFSISVFDRRHVGMGSTAASTAFLQYETDTAMADLSKRFGEANAVKIYQQGRKAIYDIGAICQKLHPALDFHIRPSLQYASFKSHTEKLLAEYKLRRKHDFKADWMEGGDIKQTFGFDAPGAILSDDAGEVDAYLLTHALFNTFRKRGHRVFNNTSIKHVEHNTKGVKLYTDAGLTIAAKKLIIACGYESLKYVPKKIAEIHSTYAFVSEPVDEKCLWHKNSLIWETATPYLYFRIADKNRVLVGGKDDRFYDPHARDSRIHRKAAMLQASFSKKIKQIPIKPDFSWAGAFAVTKDGLPYIGAIPERPNTYFALGYGGNGITFSAIAAEIICDMLLGKRNEHARLFGFDRH
jgi:glycine/D-amino acid oxidase-like deaminating enzyme